ncbi:hypothetical protein LZ31DRAFT_306524 [Colletotrichum somersetense]|nr:hypothetical protein LZ31DRAFT_306524 [Colletotrichum somersetense]
MPLEEEKCPLTPSKSQDLNYHDLLLAVKEQSQRSLKRYGRLLFRKIGKALNEKNTTIALQEKRLELDTKLEVYIPLKTKVTINPNNLFIDIKAIKQSREVAQKMTFKAAKGLRDQEIDF